MLESVKLPKDSSILSDEMILLGTTQNRTENAFRVIKVVDTKSKGLHLITNCFDLSADEIAELYKSCQAIKLFFKWLKQQLNIKKFYRQSEQAVQKSSVHCHDCVLLKRLSSTACK